ncbi:MAG: ATP-binding protein, partial [bacterium]
DEMQALEKMSALQGRREILEESIGDLIRQEERLTEWLAGYGRKAEAYVKDLGMETEDDLTAQLIRIRSQAGAARRAGERTRRCQAEREAFEKANGMSDEMIREALAERQEPSLSDLTMQLRRAAADLEKTRADAEKDTHSLQVLRGRLSQAREAAAEYEKCCRELESLQHRYQVLDRTLFYLEQARNAFHALHKDTFLEAFRIYYEYLSGEKAEAFETDAGLNILVRTEGVLREPSLFSTGCQDLIGLCRRLSMIDAMYRSEKPFLIMDDPFVSLDEERLQAGLRLVQGLSADRQVIYLTCHGSRIPQ